MRKLLRANGFELDDNFDTLITQLAGAQQYRWKNKHSNTEKLTRSTAFAVAIQVSEAIRNSLNDLGLNVEDFLKSTGLSRSIHVKKVRDINLYQSLGDAIKKYSSQNLQPLSASIQTITLSILEDVCNNLENNLNKYELEKRLMRFGLDIGRMSDALNARSLAFDVRRADPDATGSSGPATSSETSGDPAGKPSPGDDITGLDASQADDKTSIQGTTAPFYSDHPAKFDLLNRKAVAETIATMIDAVRREDTKGNNDRTFMVHLHGRWGSGKTSILNFLRESLLSQETGQGSRVEACHGEDPDPSWIIVDYNAWRNQNLGPAWWTLTESVYRQARDQLGGWWKPSGRTLVLRDRVWRIRSSYAPYAFAAVLSAIVGLYLAWIWRDQLVDPGKPWLIDGLKFIGTFIGVIAAAFAFGHNYQIGSAKTAKSYLELARDPVGPLTKRYGDLISDIGRPVAVFIDDLDRCNAHFVVELLQTIQTLFRNAEVLYVVAADRDWVCASYEQEYKAFSDTLGEPGKSLGHLFVEKVFQLSMEVPRLRDDERNAFWDGLIKSNFELTVDELAEKSDEIDQALEKAESESQILEVVEKFQDTPAVASIAASKGFKRMHAPELIREREHFLSSYANLLEPNPRAMKRLLNAYGYRRGFDIQSRKRSDPDALVRWTILENRWPILADYLEGRSGGRNETTVVEALLNDPEVIEVANGVTWEKLRPVTSAPTEPPTPHSTPH